MAHDVRLSPKAQDNLNDLHVTDPDTAERIEEVLDQLETDPALCEHEPYPHGRGAAFVTHVLGTIWHLAWIYAPNEAGVVLVGRIFHFANNGGGGLGDPHNPTP